MVDPNLMCKQHILGEHFEIEKHRHIFVKHYSIAGRVRPDDVQIEPLSMKSRHDLLAKHFKHHNSPYRMPSLAYLPKEHREAKVDRIASHKKLIEKCEDCRRLAKK